MRLWTKQHLNKSNSLTRTELAFLVNAGYAALGQNWKSTADDLRGVAHFRTNPRNKIICDLAMKYGGHLVAHLDQRPFLILRNEV